MKEPFWMINSKTIKYVKEGHLSYYHLIRTWIKSNLFDFKQIYFKKCNGNKDHFWGRNMYCLRCRRSNQDIDWIHSRRKVLMTDSTFEILKPTLKKNKIIWTKIKNEGN